MSVTRGDFLKKLGKSVPGMILGTGAAAAHTVLGKIAAVSGSRPEPAPLATSQPAPETVTRFITSGPADRSEVALTFDDGPWPGVTDRILDELKARDVRATFFMMGECVAAAPDLARRVAAEGHDIGNHTYTHPKLTELPEAKVRAEIDRTQKIMAQELNRQPVWFRPPFGAFRANQFNLVERQGMRVVLWSVDSGDWADPGEERIVGTVLEKAVAGSIVLLHDRQAQTGNCIGRILDGLLTRGLHPVTLSELMAR